MQHELNDAGGAKELAGYRLEAAKEDLAAAKNCLAQGFYRTANNRAYYAIFRSISACLALEFKSFKQHSQVMGAFNKDFVHTGIFPKEISKKINKAQEVCHASDYDDFYIIRIEEVREQISAAEEVVTMVEKYLREMRGLT